jgi:Metal binding domain of Ada
VLDHAECERARMARDPSYDGRFFTGVRTTGVYCRPVCPVRPAHPRNVCFFPSAAAAEAAGFRPCLRCRPETAPFCPAWRGSQAIVDRAARLISEEGASTRKARLLIHSPLGSALERDISLGYSHGISARHPHSSQRLPACSESNACWMRATGLSRKSPCSPAFVACTVSTPFSQRSTGEHLPKLDEEVAVAKSVDINRSMPTTVGGFGAGRAVPAPEAERQLWVRLPGLPRTASQRGICAEIIPIRRGQREGEL